MFIQTIRKTGAFNVKNLGADNSPNNSLFSNTLWGLPGFAPGFLGRTMERRPICVFMYLWMVAAL